MRLNQKRLLLDCGMRSLSFFLDKSVFLDKSDNSIKLNKKELNQRKSDPKYRFCENTDEFRWAQILPEFKFFHKCVKIVISQIDGEFLKKKQEKLDTVEEAISQIKARKEAIKENNNFSNQEKQTKRRLLSQEMKAFVCNKSKIKKDIKYHTEKIEEYDKLYPIGKNGIRKLRIDYLNNNIQSRLQKTSKKLDISSINTLRDISFSSYYSEILMNRFLSD